MPPDAGAVAALVNVGGDLRAAGTPATADGAWTVAVDDPHHPGRDVAVIAISAGAVATTSCTRRRWRRAGEVRHHLIDPATGRPAATGLASVTVIAATALWAEVLAKAVFVSGSAEAAGVLEGTGAAALLVHDDGAAAALGGMEDYLR